MTFEEIAQLVKVNETDKEKVLSIATSIKMNTFKSPALLVWEDMNEAVTGSHRIAAVKFLIEEDEERWFDVEMETVDVSEIMAECESPEYDNLRSIFVDTEFETVAKENEEW